MKIVCKEIAVPLEVQKVTLYRPRENEWCLAYLRQYPWTYDCPICFCKDSIIEGNCTCHTCRLEVNWVEVLRKDENGRNLMSENQETLNRLGAVEQRGELSGL